jgi:aldehyde dehydrogenase
VKLICVTGGPAVAKAALQSSKRAIVAGPGNPPVVVDETADLDNAARSIIAGRAYDNNLLCIGEKQVFVVASVFDRMMEAMETGRRRCGSIATQVDALTAKAIVMDRRRGPPPPGALQRLHRPGRRCPRPCGRDWGREEVELLFGETDGRQPVRAGRADDAVCALRPL